MTFKSMFNTEEKEPPAVEKEEKPKAQKWHVVRTIAGKTLLIEYQKGSIVSRVLLPAEAVRQAGKVTEGMLDTGAQYGLPWARILKGDSKLENELHAVGIWTKEDFISLHLSARSILKAHKMDYGESIKSILKFTKDGGQHD